MEYRVTKRYFRKSMKTRYQPEKRSSSEDPWVPLIGPFENFDSMVVVCQKYYQVDLRFAPLEVLKR